MSAKVRRVTTFSSDGYTEDAAIRSIVKAVAEELEALTGSAQRLTIEAKEDKRYGGLRFAGKLVMTDEVY